MSETKGPNPVLQARNAATAALIEAHQEEWNDLMDKACADRGVTWSRPLTPEQKAANDIAALLDKYPHLRDQFAPGALDGPPAVAAEA
jgi:hypothetical protein